MMLKSSTNPVMHVQLVKGQRDGVVESAHRYKVEASFERIARDILGHIQSASGKYKHLRHGLLQQVT